MISENLYILKSYDNSGNYLLKLGYSSNIKRRILDYIAHNPFVEVIGTFYRKDAEYFERYFHSTNKSTHRNEWYDKNMLNKILYEINNCIPIKKKLKKEKFIFEKDCTLKGKERTYLASGEHNKAEAIKNTKIMLDTVSKWNKEEDGKLTYKSLAKKLGFSYNTVLKRKKNLTVLFTKV